ncbi:carboxypeptidase-like regulatory domain-containing protein [Pedobacter chinensis]|uniref:Carboxypeptidase-like regulatory domain-containing protein n=1 Tax=Pedobacter chinensis TaxID=2282421 RepID=A0A369PXD0_9SPHI|nr:carboxypeptidase-like regulatory domain-containing protein [Pedobacter chinensis]RDC56932.1 carboxypeptidase-like regulatory domain-containing protein [Pedobacter chinensis]
MIKDLLKKYFIGIFLILFTIPSVLFAQSMLMGKVLNEQNMQPVQNASVYFNNTQVGTITNEKGQFKLYSKRLYSDLIVSAVGYEKAIININGNNSTYTVLLKEKSNELIEVTIGTGKNDWKKWGDLFFRLLLGKDHNAAYCKILNPEDVKFYYDESNHYLEISSNKPILIKHLGLDCTLHVDIDKFTYDFLKDELDYHSGIYYSNIDAKPIKKINTFLKNSYLGSKMHFFRSLYSNTLEEENFQLYRYSSIKNINKENAFRAVQLYKAKKIAAGAKGHDLLKLSDYPDSAEYYRKLLMQDDVLKWDTTRVNYREYLTFDSLNNKMIFKFSDTLMVLYKRDNNLAYNITRQHVSSGLGAISLIELKTLLCLTNQEGVIIDPAGFALPNVLLMIGNMGDRRLAHQLPYDFIYSP